MVYQRRVSATRCNRLAKQWWARLVPSNAGWKEPGRSRRPLAVPTSAMNASMNESPIHGPNPGFRRLEPWLAEIRSLRSDSDVDGVTEDGWLCPVGAFPEHPVEDLAQRGPLMIDEVGNQHAGNRISVHHPVPHLLPRVK